MTGAAPSPLRSTLARFSSPIYRSSLFLLLNSGVTSVLGFAFWAVGARYYSAAEVGIASGVSSAVLLLVAFSRLGLDTGLMRFLASDTDKPRLLNTTLTAAVLASLVLGAAFIAGLRLWSPALACMQRDVPTLLFFLLFTVLLGGFAIVNAAFASYTRTDFTLAQNLVIGILRLALPVALISAGLGADLFLMWGVPLLGGALVSGAFVSRVMPGFRLRFSVSGEAWKRVFKFSYQSYLATFLESAPKFVLPLLVINLLGAEMSAYFRAGWMVASLLFLAVPTAICTALLAEGARDPARLRKDATRAGGLLLAVSGAGIGALYLFGEPVLLLFGADYAANARDLLLILAVSSIPCSVIQMFLTVLIVRLRMRLVIMIDLLAAVVTLSLVAVLANVLGLNGFGIGWTASQTLVAAGLGAAWLVRRQF